MIAESHVRHPGDSEYAAAAAALCDQTPSPRTLAVGDYVSGVTKGKAWSGEIVSICGSRIDVEADMAWITVDARDITH